MTKAVEEFLRNAAPLKEGDRRVAAKSYYSYFEEHKQIPAETLKVIAEGEKELVSGSIHLATHDLAAEINRAKEADESIADLSSSVTIVRPNGPLKTTVYASSEVTNPSTQEKSTKFGKVRVNAKVSTLVVSKDAQHASDVISKLLG